MTNKKVFLNNKRKMKISKVSKKKSLPRLNIKFSIPKHTHTVIITTIQAIKSIIKIQHLD